MSAPAEVASLRVPSQALPGPGLLRVEVGELALCLARTASGNWDAVDDSCTHEDCSPSAGELAGEAGTGCSDHRGGGVRRVGPDTESAEEPS